MTQLSVFTETGFFRSRAKQECGSDAQPVLQRIPGHETSQDIPAPAGNSGA